MIAMIIGVTAGSGFDKQLFTVAAGNASTNHFSI